MSFNIFDSATKDSIRVGYIDPDRGYLSGQSIYEANVHASKNPGAVFILETRDRVRYLTINEVNKLTVKDITPDETSCEDGIKGLRPLDISNFLHMVQGVVQLLYLVIMIKNQEQITLTGRRLPPRQNQVKVGASGGTPLTVGGRGGKPVTAGGKILHLVGDELSLEELEELLFSLVEQVEHQFFLIKNH